MKIKLKEIIKDCSIKNILNIKHNLELNSNEEISMVEKKGILVYESYEFNQLKRYAEYLNADDNSIYISMGKGLIKVIDRIYYGDILVKSEDFIRNDFKFTNDLNYVFVDDYDKYEFVYSGHYKCDSDLLYLDNISIGIEADRFWIAQRTIASNYTVINLSCKLKDILDVYGIPRMCTMVRELNNVFYEQQHLENSLNILSNNLYDYSETFNGILTLLIYDILRNFELLDLNKNEIDKYNIAVKFGDSLFETSEIYDYLNLFHIDIFTEENDKLVSKYLFDISNIDKDILKRLLGCSSEIV